MPTLRYREERVGIQTQILADSFGKVAFPPLHLRFSFTRYDRNTVNLEEYVMVNCDDELISLLFCS